MKKIIAALALICATNAASAAAVCWVKIGDYVFDGYKISYMELTSGDNVRIYFQTDQPIWISTAGATASRKMVKDIITIVAKCDK